MHTNQLQFAARNLWSGILFGVGMVTFIDEAVFHQILRWHHFYDKSTTEIGIISDGFFHAFSWFATIGGLFLLADLRRKNAYWPLRWLGGVLIGAGAFQFYDGTIQHKVMKVHQIRYVENVLLYDIVWNLIAIALIVLGLTFLDRAKRKNQHRAVQNNEH